MVSEGHNSSSLVRKSKLLGILAHLLILVSIILLIQNPSNGTYEFSIYSALPLAFWAQLIISIIIGFIVLMILCGSLPQIWAENRPSQSVKKERGKHVG